MNNTHSNSSYPQYVQLALRFVTSVIESKFDEAHRDLSADLQKTLSADDLRVSYQNMLEYAEDQVSALFGEPQYSDMHDWPHRNPHDVGWVYISLVGDDFLEAISVIVESDPQSALEQESLRIRQVEWGRP